jgi:hypothetical protein
VSAVYRSARPFCVRSITNKRLGALAAVTLASLVAFFYFVDARAQYGEKYIWPARATTRTTPERHRLRGRR